MRRVVWTATVAVGGLVGHLFQPPQLAAQNDEVAFQLWPVLHQAWLPRGKWQPGGDFGLRFQADDLSAYTRIQADGTVRYLFNRSIDARGGLRLFYTFQQDVNQFELRPYQGAQFIWPRFGKVDLRHLFRLEERFVFQTGSSPGLSLRLRYRIATVIPIGGLLERVTGYNRVSIPVSAELFFADSGDIQEQFGSTLRLAAGVSYIVNKEWSGDASLIFEKSRDTEAGGDFRTSTIMLRIDIRHNRPAIAQ
jgi:hypothetical protein